MNQQEMNTLKEEIIKLKEEYENRLSDDNSEAEDAGDTGELSSYDNHPGDQGTELFERQKEMTLDKHLKDNLLEVEDALKAMEEGSYGICAECGKEIPFERLEVMPTTKWCIDHANNNRENDQRPVEEDVTSPIDQTAKSYKEELRQESWDSVSEHGTSETPSDK